MELRRPSRCQSVDSSLVAHLWSLRLPWWGRQGKAGGGESGGRSCSSLQGGLIAEYDFQFLAVKLASIREIHDALSVVGQLVDAHLLAMGNTEEGHTKVNQTQNDISATLERRAIGAQCNAWL